MPIVQLIHEEGKFSFNEMYEKSTQEMDYGQVYSENGFAVEQKAAPPLQSSIEDSLSTGINSLKQADVSPHSETSDAANGQPARAEASMMEVPETQPIAIAVGTKRLCDSTGQDPIAIEPPVITALGGVSVPELDMPNKRLRPTDPESKMDDFMQEEKPVIGQTFPDPTNKPLTPSADTGQAMCENQIGAVGGDSDSDYESVHIDPTPATDIEEDDNSEEDDESEND